MPPSRTDDVRAIFRIDVQIESLIHFQPVVSRKGRIIHIGNAIADAQRCAVGRHVAGFQMSRDHGLEHLHIDADCGIQGIGTPLSAQIGFFITERQRTAELFFAVLDDALLFNLARIEYFVVIYGIAVVIGFSGVATSMVRIMECIAVKTDSVLDFAR